MDCLLFLYYFSVEMVKKYNQNFLSINAIHASMRLRQFIFPLIALIIPWVIIIAGIIADIQNTFLYVGAILWFSLGLIFIIALT